MLETHIVQIRKGTKRITLQRFLTSKIAYKGEDFTEIELAAMFHNQLWLQTKCQTDRNFNQKFGTDLESLSKILRTSNFSRGLTSGSITSMRKQLLALTWDFLIPQRNFSTVESRVKNSIITKWRKPQGVPTKELPPEKYIGKGYRDKGTARNPSTDANPEWQEVASVAANLEREINELRDYILEEERTALEKIRASSRILKLGQKYERVLASSRNSRNAKAVTKKV